MREHTEKLRPPRSLWVPFPLGRPLGVPHDRAFQTDILRRLLALFERPSGPLIEDYPNDAAAPEPAEEETWSCPLPLPPLEPAATHAERLTQALQSEAAFLLPWYGEALQRKGRTLFGLSGLTIDDVPDMAAFVATFASGEDAKPPAGAREQTPAVLRSIVDDLKTLYLEAVAFQPGKKAPGPGEMNRWLYHETRFGDLMYEIRDRLAREAQAAGTPNQPGRPPLIAVIPNAFRDRPSR